MNINNIIVFDFETGGLKKDSEITQVAAVAIHPRRLEIIDEFNTEIKPLFPEKLDDEALKITRKTREKLALAPHPENVMKDLKQFCDRYNLSKRPFTAPIAAGYNIDGFDMPILQRYAETYGFIDKSTEKQTFFSTYMTLDLMKIVFWWTENSDTLPNIKQPTLVEAWLHESADMAHDALYDVKASAKLIIKFLKLQRYLYPKINFTGK